jgi:acetyl esterase/lipase
MLPAKKIIFMGLFAVVFSFLRGNAQNIIPLYGDNIPNARPTANTETTDSSNHIANVSRPTLTLYMPARGKATGTAVVICPGGGYVGLAAGHEGKAVAQRLADSGIVGIVLKYRLPDDRTMVDKTIGPLQDAQRAIQYVRENAARLGVDPHRIGIMGFSAGGHLASSEGTHYNQSYISNPLHISLRPDFMILGYPVISFTDSLANKGSRDNLLGPNPPQDSIIKYSGELQVTDQTPPTFLVHAKDDNVVKVQNSLDFAEALRKHHVPVEVYLYEHGGHGFGMNNRTSSVDWLAIALTWLHTQGY